MNYSILTGILVAIFMISFFVKNKVTSNHIRGPLKGKSWKVRILVILISILYCFTYVSIFFGTEYLYRIGFLDFCFIKTTGILLVGIATLIGLFALINMKDSWRMGITKNQKTDLITEGIFSYSRNPYFLSYYIIFLGVFMVFPTILFLLVYIPVVIITHLMVLDEEQFLSKLHGDAYQKYTTKVNRYLPF